MELHGDQKRPKEHVDPFTSLMFGINKGDQHNQDEESTEESFSSQTERSDEPQWDPWLFGARGDHKGPQTHAPYSQIENLLNQVDLFLLMDTVDEAIKTYKMYEPLFKEVTPFFKKFIKKK